MLKVKNGGILANLIDGSLGEIFWFFSAYSLPPICGIDWATSPPAEKFSQLAAKVQKPHMCVCVPDPA